MTYQQYSAKIDSMHIPLKELLDTYSPAYGDNWEHAFEIANEDKEVITEVTHDYQNNGGFRNPILLSKVDDTDKPVILDGMHRITILHNLNEPMAYVHIGYPEEVSGKILDVHLFYDNVATESEQELIWDHADKNMSWPLITSFDGVRSNSAEKLRDCWVNIDGMGSSMLDDNVLRFETMICLSESDTYCWELIAAKVKKRFSFSGYTPRMEAKIYADDDYERKNPLDSLTIP